MIRLPRPRQPRQRENTIALINIVFLMLIFFLIAGTLTPPLDGEVNLIGTEDAGPAEPPRALFITADGRLRAQGAGTSIEAFVAARGEENDPGADEPLKVAADRDLPAAMLVDIVGQLRAAGVDRISIVTERSDR